MKTKDFFYELPEELIAQKAIEPRDSSRLMLVDRKNRNIAHNIFSNLPLFLNEGDLLVVNNSKVLPARLLGKTEHGGECEMLLLSQHEGDLWECLVRPGRRLKPGKRAIFGDGELIGTIEKTLDGGNRLVSFEHKNGTLLENFYRFGKMPLPPYIKSDEDATERYQTVYAKSMGSAAAPTAGLHFTDRLLDEVRKKGINITEITLHIGLGTFRPVEAEDIADHKMHSEWFEVGEDTINLINKTKTKGGRVICVGTTAARTLEGLFKEKGELVPYSGNTDIFITPGYEFKVVDALITNFHLPQSTLLMLVSALAGKELIDKAYKTAIDEKYRFFSYGDAMIIT